LPASSSVRPGATAITHHKYRRDQEDGAVMDSDDGRADLTDCDVDDDIDEATYRERAAATIDQIAQQVKKALADAAISIDVFLVVPGSGNAIVTFGTIADPDDEAWKTVSEIVSAVVRRAIGLDRSRCRSLACATTHDQAQQNALA
jgi:hypothetical protein